MQMWQIHVYFNELKTVYYIIAHLQCDVKKR